VAFLATLLLCSRLWARPTTADEAALVATGWLKADPQPFGAALGRQVMNVQTFSAGNGPAYYIVNLQPSGFVIVPADDSIEPIVGFADDGTYDPSPENPLVALVTADLDGRIAAARNSSSFHLDVVAENPDSPASKWQYLTELAENPGTGFELMGLMHPADIRVLPLVQSRWGQTTACGEYCYNYYSPYHYPAGCVATAMAQVMRYYEYPTDAIGVHEFMIGVSRSRGEQTASTRGGDGLGGPYNWGAMVLRPEASCSTLTDAHRQAIGALCYDAGVAVKMSYTSSGSGALMPDAKDALVNVFQYSNAILGYDPEGGLGSGLTDMINPDLDAGDPVILAVLDPCDPTTGHSLVCDGYGYESSTLYHHLNMGWLGIDDAWYNLPRIDGSKAKYTMVFTCIYNIFTTGSGEVVSGRVLDPAGRPIVNARVFTEGDGGTTHTAVTNDRGIYALVNMDSDTAYTIRSEAAGCVFSSRAVETGNSRDNSARSGNRWGVDFYAVTASSPPAPKFIYVDANAPLDPGPGDPEVSDPNEDGSPEHPFDAIQQAIDAAVSGDTVVILSGTYSGQGNRDLDFKGKAITVRSEDPNEPNLVTIECDGTADNPHRGFQFHSYETPLSVLDGLTITGGYYERGGAMYFESGVQPTVIRCTLRANSALLGGAVYNESNPKMVDCTFSASSADAGGGVYNDGEASECNPILVNCVFRGNSATQNGGGLYNLGQGAKPVLTNCTFVQNAVSGGGGGAMRNNISASPSLINCLFIENAAATSGGAIRNSNGAGVTLINCTFGANLAASGNAVACTPDDGGSQSAGAVDVVNGILWDAGNEIFNDDSSIVTVTYSDVQDDVAAAPWPGEGNMDADPYFADPSRYDYHLKSQVGRYDPVSRGWVLDTVTSPCIDAGDTATPIGVEPLPNGGVVNMGAYGGTTEASKSHPDSVQSQ
jgi:Peptidase C10 family/Spi protease inhibitor/Carboxypeptidase regulatory-like domain/Disaggregatase related/Right handed beta helix region